MPNKCDKIKRKCKYERYKMNKNVDEHQEVGTGDLISIYQDWKMKMKT